MDEADAEDEAQKLREPPGLFIIVILVIAIIVASIFLTIFCFSK